MERLYYHDCYLKEFDAEIVERVTLEGKPGVVLDRTAFYPTSGGQPNDMGTINGIPVLDVIEDGEKVVHILQRSPEERSVHGVIDWRRRFDHMQQHTGQHILSQAFVRVAKAETIGFHMGSDVSNIDLDVGSIENDLLWKVEDLANSIIQQNLPVRISYADVDDLGKYGLRKDPARKGTIRIVAVEGFDASACGGTHLSSTGEAGLIKIRKSEKVGSKLRVDFYCGMRAIDDYRWKNSFITAYSNRFTTGERELGEAIEKLENETRRTRKELKELKERLITYEAEEMLNDAATVKGCRIVRKLFKDRDVQEVKMLSAALKKKNRVIAMFAVLGNGATLIFSRSDDVDLDVSRLLKNRVEAAGGRGGGRADSAQGGLPDAQSGENALEQAYSDIVAEIG